MVIKGKIKTVKRIRYRNQECDGIAIGDKQEFLIKVANNTFKENNFPEVLLHEMIHVWFFICFAVYGRVVSEREQHKIIDQIVPRMSRRLQRALRKSKRKHK